MNHLELRTHRRCAPIFFSPKRGKPKIGKSTLWAVFLTFLKAYGRPSTPAPIKLIKMFAIILIGSLVVVIGPDPVILCPLLRMLRSVL